MLLVIKNTAVYNSAGTYFRSCCFCCMNRLSLGSRKEEGNWKEIYIHIYRHTHIYIYIYIGMKMAGGGLLCLLCVLQENFFADAQRCKVGGTQVEVCNADGKPHSPAPHHGARAWLPTGFLGKKSSFQKHRGSLSISWSWAWIRPQKRLFFTVAKSTQSNFTEQQTGSLSELIAAKEYCST